MDYSISATTNVAQRKRSLTLPAVKRDENIPVLWLSRELKIRTDFKPRSDLVCCTSEAQFAGYILKFTVLGLLFRWHCGPDKRTCAEKVRCQYVFTAFATLVVRCMSETVKERDSAPLQVICTRDC